MSVGGIKKGREKIGCEGNRMRQKDKMRRNG